MNNLQKCSLRDKKLINLLNEQTALTTEQVKLLLFKDVSLRVAQNRLNKLTLSKRIKRDRFTVYEPYFYYLSSKPGQIEHVLGVSWIYVWVMLSLGNMENLHCFEREVDYKVLRPDAFIGVKNLWSGNLTFFYAEMDIDESGNDFSIKVRRYNNFYELGLYQGLWWNSLAKRFPEIRVVTTGSVKTLKKKIEKENIHGLEFQVFTLDQIKEECVYGSSGSASIRAK